MESNKIVLVKFDTLVINHPMGCLPRNQSLTHHDITAGFDSGDDSNLLYHIVNYLRKKRKNTKRLRL